MRYPTKDVYVEKVIEAVDDLMSRGFLLEEDGRVYIENAKRTAWPPEEINSPPFWKLIE